MGSVIAISLAFGCLIIGISSGNSFQGFITAIIVGGGAWFAFAYNPSEVVKTINFSTDIPKPTEKCLVDRISDAVNIEIMTAADSGNVDAMILVGYSYLSGINGLSQDIQKAGSYLLKAAEQNKHFFASFVVAGLYREGLVFQKDVHKAYYWGLEAKRALHSADNAKVLQQMLLALGSLNNKIVGKIISGAVTAQHSFPSVDGEVAVSHEKMADELLQRSFSTMRGVIGQSDDRPIIIGRGPLPVAYAEYVQETASKYTQTNWPVGDVLGYLRNMNPGDILLIPGWSGTRRSEEKDEAYDLTDEGWVAHRGC